MSPRTVVFRMVLSLDGFPTSPDGTHEWMFEWFGDESTERIADLKARDEPGTVLVHGGPGLAASLVRLRLVDEFQLSTVPIAIGAGRSGALAQTLVPRA